MLRLSLVWVRVRTKETVYHYITRAPYLYYVIRIHESCALRHTFLYVLYRPWSSQRPALILVSKAIVLEERILTIVTLLLLAFSAPRPFKIA